MLNQGHAELLGQDLVAWYLQRMNDLALAEIKCSADSMSNKGRTQCDVILDL